MEILDLIYWPALEVAAILILILACRHLVKEITHDENGWIGGGDDDPK